MQLALWPSLFANCFSLLTSDFPFRLTPLEKLLHMASIDGPVTLIEMLAVGARLPKM